MGKEAKWVNRAEQEREITMKNIVELMGEEFRGKNNKKVRQEWSKQINKRKKKKRKERMA